MVLLCALLYPLIMCCDVHGREFMQHDVRIKASEIYKFEDGDGCGVIVSVGRFSLVSGTCSIDGDKAVIWIKTQNTGGLGKHSITVYVEGNVRINDGGNVSVNDSTMLVRLNAQGNVAANGDNEEAVSLRGSPLYERAVSTRDRENMRLVSLHRKAISEGRTIDESPVTISSRETEEEDTGKSDPLNIDSLVSGNDENTSLEDKPLTSSKPTRDEKGTVSRKDSRPEMPNIIFRTGKEGFISQPDPADPDRRVFISRGRTFLSQGTSDSEQYVEMQADSVVVFSRKGKKDRPPEGGEKVPYAPGASGLGVAGERVTGVYLEGDVRLIRGERSINASEIYVDFVDSRALLIKPVMKTVQEERNQPIYVRASEARQLSDRKMVFYDAKVSTSDFRTMTYHFGANRAVITDQTPYDEEGERVGETRYGMEAKGSTFNIRGFPVLYNPSMKSTLEQGHTPLRSASIGSYQNLGTGVRSKWHFFRLLGLVQPEGLDSVLEADFFEKGAFVSLEGDYQRSRANDSRYTGYYKVVGVYDMDGDDDLGKMRKSLDAPSERGRVLVRHREFLPGDWTATGELSLLSDKRFLEMFYRSEYWTGKDQENLIHFKKQRDNWMLSVLLKARLNDFMTQTEHFPEIAGYLTGEPLWGDRLTYFGEARVGGIRYREDDTLPSALAPSVRSDMMARFDTRHEIDMPLRVKTPAGPLHVVPYAVARLTYWSDAPRAMQRTSMYSRPGYFGGRSTMPSLAGGGSHSRFYGEGGVRASMQFWRIYDNVRSKLLDVDRLKHIVTPELIAFGSTTGGVEPEDLFPMTEAVETSLRENVGFGLAVRNTLQTKRGPEGNKRTVDWMRIDGAIGFFADPDPTLAGDGRMFSSRPEYSLQRSFASLDYYWSISNDISLLADAHFDIEDGEFDLANIGISVKRDPRLTYYAGLRYIKDLNSTVGTFGLDYRINKKYTISVFEQYEFDYRGGISLGSELWIVRKFPRWYIGLSLSYDARYTGENRVGIQLLAWPEGIPEARPSLGRMQRLLDSSSEN